MAKKSIDSEEIDLFCKSVKEVQPLKHDKHWLRPKKKTSISLSQKKIAPASSWQTYLDSNDWLDAEDPIHFAKIGLQHKLIHRLKRGHVPIEANIDLHRQTIDESVRTITHFINDCLAKNKRWMCIIHGKGHLSNDKPILKNFLNNWLRDNPNILAFHSAPPHQGGTGALIVLLKQWRNHEK